MTWHETHRRWRALREVEAAAQHDPTGTLPWKDEYAAVFGDPEGLVAALRYRWRLVVEAQLDGLTEPQLSARAQQLARRHTWLLRVLDRHDRDLEDQPLARVS